MNSLWSISYIPKSKAITATSAFLKRNYHSMETQNPEVLHIWPWYFYSVLTRYSCKCYCAVRVLYDLEYLIKMTINHSAICSTKTRQLRPRATAQKFTKPVKRPWHLATCFLGKMILLKTMEIKFSLFMWKMFYLLECKREHTTCINKIL